MDEKGDYFTANILTIVQTQVKHTRSHFPSNSYLIKQYIKDIDF